MKPSNTTTSGKATGMIAGVCTFPRLPCPSTKQPVMLNLTSAAAAAAGGAAGGAAATAAATALRTAGWSCSVFFFFFQLSCESYMVMDVVVQNSQKSSRYDQGTTMRKKHVSRDSKICCCCCRFCCGAPTTDERIHAPVLHDASQIDYCRH